MGILDDAIREHLDLKRKHGARDAELREIEDEAFGSGDQPDPFSSGGELFGEATSSGSPAAQGTTATEEPPPGLGEPPAGLEEPPAGGEEPTRLVEPETSEPELGIPDEPAPPPEADDVDAPAPSESLEDLIAEEEPFPEDTAAPHPVSPEQESLDVPALDPDEAQEPPLEPADEAQERPLEPSDSVPDPPPPPPDTGPEPPGRARGRVDVPTQEHPPPGQTGDLPPFPSDEADFESEVGLPQEDDEPFTDEGPADSGGSALYDFETDEDSVTTGEPAPDTDDDFEALGPAEEEAPYLEEEEPYAEEPGPSRGEPFDEPSTEVRPSIENEDYDERPSETRGGDEDDDEDLWFEKGPPKDFDFDD